jgi:hypothetical protein
MREGSHPERLWLSNCLVLVARLLKQALHETLAGVESGEIALHTAKSNAENSLPERRVRRPVELSAPAAKREKKKETKRKRKSRWSRFEFQGRISARTRAGEEAK